MSYSPHIRLRVLTVGGLLLIGVLGFRLIDLQILRYDHFQNVAEAQRMRAAELNPSRGTIYLESSAEGELFPVASNRRGWSAFAVPKDMEDPEGVAHELAPELAAFRERQRERIRRIMKETGQHRYMQEETKEDDEDKEQQSEEEVILEDLLAKFTKEDDPYEPFLRPHELLDEEIHAFLTEKEYPGIVLEERSARTYPEGDLAAHVLGYLGFDGTGQVGRYGIEGYFHEKLEGSLGWLAGERDTRGRVIGVANNEFQPAQNGSDIVLTIDRVVQSYIQEELKRGVEQYDAERGSILVMDPSTGAILGMATYPTFDPNMYYAIADARVQTNPVVSDIFEPGSILKPVVMAAAMEEEIITPNTTFMDDGPVRVGGFTINTFDRQHHGLQTMTQVMEKSNNVGMVWIAEQMGRNMVYEYFRRFGIGERTGVELEGETQTNVTEPSRWSAATLATTSFGQGVVVTPLQALNAINAIANGGRLMQPYIVSSVIRDDGTKEEKRPHVVRQVLSERTALKMSEVLVSVIENGTGQTARMPGYYLAGKTGTAQVADDRGRYSDTDKIITFAGYGPAQNPRFSILVKLDNPSGLSFASGTSAPMFKNISEKLLQYYQVPPSYDSSVPQSPFRVED